MIRLVGVIAIGLSMFCTQLSWGASATPLRFREFVKIATDRELYVDWIKAQPGQPTVVLLNGMTYSTKYWDAFAEVLAAKGIGVLRYDMYGMGNTLLNDASSAMTRNPFAAFEAQVYTAMGLPQDMIDRLVHSPVLNAIHIEDQTKDLKLLIDKLNLTGKLNFVGLSYGGAVGIDFASKYPELINTLTIQAPYTEPMAEQVKSIQDMIDWTRRMFPFNPASDRSLYDFWLRTIVYTTYPKVEPSVLDNPFKLEATFRLAQGATDWRASALVNQLPEGKLHLMIAGDDQYIKRQVLEDFWATIPSLSRASKVIVNGSEHKIPEAVPGFAANWVYEIVKGNSVIADGTAFDADPRTGVVRYPGGELRISNARSAPAHLRTAEVASSARILEVHRVSVQRARISCYAAHASVQ